MKVAVMGSGSWGTVFSKVAVDAGNEVVLWSRNSDIANSINSNHTNPFYVSDIELPKKLIATTDASSALADADVVVVGLPSQAYRDNLTAWKSLIPANSVLVSLAKGIEFESNMRMTQVMAQATGFDAKQLAVLSGPNLAHEIAEQQPTATTVACIDEERL